ncbi:MAG: TRAP transporter large permease, partial [Dehalococcoidia bacterium]|nr:TRAP transporter large permease [Dehalococcoidia bacterium]
VPLFILMAEVLTSARFSELLFEAASRMLNRVPGGLAIASVVACAGFGAVCGSSAATAATIGGPAIPEMLRRGYDKRLSVGAVAAGGTLGILIPPIIAMILFGIINQVSIGQLYIAGVIPGVLMTILLSGAIALAVRLRPGLAPSIGPVTWARRLEALKRVWPFVALAAAMIVPIYMGVATPTEAAAIGAAAAIVYGAATRRLSRAEFGHALLRTVQTTSMIMFLVIGGFMLGFVFSSLAIPQSISKLIVSLDVNRWVVMILINVLFFLLGRYLDPLSIMVLIMPTLFPVVVDLGFDPIWFGVITIINTEVDNILPPDGVNLLVLKSIVPEGVSMDDIMLGSLPFVLVLVLGMALLMVFPEIALWLPRQMK